MTYQWKKFILHLQKSFWGRSWVTWCSWPTTFITKNTSKYHFWALSVGEGSASCPCGYTCPLLFGIRHDFYTLCNWRTRNKNIRHKTMKIQLKNGKPCGVPTLQRALGVSFRNSHSQLFLRPEFPVSLRAKLIHRPFTASPNNILQNQGTLIKRKEQM